MSGRVELNGWLEELCIGYAILLGDQGYDRNAIRAKAAEKKVWANIPPRSNRISSFVFWKWIYRQRNLNSSEAPPPDMTHPI